MPTVYSPPVSTYVPLATITLASTDSEVVFANIPNTYRDLVLVINAKYTGISRTTFYCRLNGDSGNNYNLVAAGGNGSSAVSYAQTGVNYFYGLISNQLSVNTHQFMDYSATDKHKLALTRISDAAGAAASESISMLAQRWANTAAITSITLTPTNNSIAGGSTFSLYGIEA
jgi:hypothetical protein